MRKLASALLAGLVACLWIIPAQAQSPCPNIATGAVLTAAQWQFCFTSKNDVLGYAPVNRAGDTMTGKLVTAASSTLGAGLNLPQGTAPSAPLNGDVWTTASGVYVRINGVTISLTSVRPFITSARTYYVRTDGSDSLCSGLVDAAASAAPNCAFLTEAAAVGTVSGLDFNKQTVTIQFGNEGSAKTFTRALVAIPTLTGGGLLKFEPSPSGTNIVGTSGAYELFDTLTAVTFGGLNITSSGNYGSIIVSGLSILQFDAAGPTMGAATTSRIWCHDNQAQVLILGSTYTVVGNSSYWMVAANGCMIFHEANTVTFSGTPVFSTVVTALHGGKIQSSSDTYTGAVVGQRYGVNDSGSMIAVSPFSETYFPGNGPGQALYPSSYVGQPALSGIVVANGAFTPTAVNTSAGLFNVISDPTGTAGKLVFDTNPIFPSWAVFGVDTRPSTVYQVAIGNASGNSSLWMGQDAAHGGFIQWQYNATPGLSSLAIATQGYSQPIALNGSLVAINQSSLGDTYLFGTLHFGTSANGYTKVSSGTVSYSSTVPTTDLTGTLQAAQEPAHTGDVTNTAGSLALTLATVNSNVGTFGSATQSVQFTVNGKGLITAAANVTITPAVTSITGFGTGVATALGINVGSAGAFVPFNGALGTPTSGVATNLTGTAPGLTAGNVTTNANLTGVITSSGNATSIASQTGTGTKFVVDTNPALVAPTATTLAVGGCTIGGLVFCANGNMTSSGSTAGLGVISRTGAVPFLWYSAAGTTLDLDNGTGSVVQFSAGALNAGAVKVLFTTASTSKTTGAIINLGGFGNAGAMFTDTLSVITMAQTSAAQSGTVCYNSSTGLITYDATLGCLTSFKNAKNIERELDPSECISIVLQLRAVEFTKKVGFGGEVDPAKQIGFAAEDVEAVDSRLTARRPDGSIGGVRYAQDSAIYSCAIRQLKADNDNLRAANDNLETRIKQLEGRVQ